MRLVNLGIPQGKGKMPLAFPICAECGATRSPLATEGELTHFDEEHAKLHKRNATGQYALHVELTTDTIALGPFSERHHAVNLFESLRVGARLVLDMGTTEVDGFSLIDEALDDEGSLAVKLQELAIYLGLNPEDVPGGGR